jgi:hypothetical protein
MSNTTQATMKTAEFTAHQAAVKNLLNALNIDCKNTEVARLAAAGDSMSAVAAAIRATYPQFESVPQVVGIGDSDSGMVARHGSTLTDVSQELLAFYESKFATPSEIEYSHIARAFAPDMGSSHRGPEGFVSFLAAKGLELTRKNASGKTQNKWWMLKAI